MAEPLNYRSRDQLPDDRNDPPKKPASGARAAIPIEFDFQLTESDDHAGVRAVEAALRQQKIAFFTTHDGAPANRQFEIHVRSTDREAASHLAARAFARRKRIKSFPREVPPKDQTGGDISGGVDLGPF